MDIFIPSRGRWMNELTWHRLPHEWRKRAYVVVPHTEAKEHKGSAYEVLPCNKQGIGPTRQWIISRASGAVLMLDDDISFFTRRADDRTKFVKATPDDVRDMLASMQEVLRRHTHASIAQREGGNRNVERYLFNTRMLRALGYRADLLMQQKIRFDRVPVMEDFDVALQLLERGHKSVTLNDWVQDQGRSNAPGGCSTYRTAAVQADGAKTLAKLHPKYVTVVEKPGWEGMGSTRLDVRVAWKKAYEDAR